MNKHYENQYVVGATGDTLWHGTTATTLVGAKRVASKLYTQTLNSNIIVAIFDGNQYNEIAVKYGYNKKWTNI